MFVSGNYKASKVADVVGLSPQIRKTLKTTRMEIIHTTSTHHGFKHFACFPLWPECFCSEKPPARLKDCSWALCKKGLSTITQVMLGIPFFYLCMVLLNAQSSLLTKSGLATYLHNAKKIVSLHGQHIHACVVELAPAV